MSRSWRAAAGGLTLMPTPNQHQFALINSKTLLLRLAVVDSLSIYFELYHITAQDEDRKYTCAYRRNGRVC